MTTYHAPTNGSPFDPALCGHKPEADESTWVCALPEQVNCVVCLSLLGVAS